VAAPLRVAAAAAAAWALATLAGFDRQTRDHSGRAAGPRHLLVLLDVSPSMLLSDAGAAGTETRMGAPARCSGACSTGCRATGSR
jgi:Ca-activated chloride channel homolog